MADMDDEKTVIRAAERLSRKDDEALALEIGLRDKLITSDPKLGDQADLAVSYGTHMGLIEDVKALGWRILARWNRELYRVVCSSTKKEDQELRVKLFAALDINEAALIAVVAPAIVWLGAPVAIAAAVAPLIVKKFIVPAKEELCISWGEAIAATP
jgi:hypothetical protein